MSHSQQTTFDCLGHYTHANVRAPKCEIFGRLNVWTFEHVCHLTGNWLDAFSIPSMPATYWNVLNDNNRHMIEVGTIPRNHLETSVRYVCWSWRRDSMFSQLFQLLIVVVERKTVLVGVQAIGLPWQYLHIRRIRKCHRTATRVSLQWIWLL